MIIRILFLDGILSLNDLLVILYEINKIIEPIFLKLLENRKEIRESYQFPEKKLNALLMEEFKKSLGEITINVYNKYNTNSEIITKSTKKYKNIKEYNHIALELVNMKKTLLGETPESVEIPDFLTKDYAILIYDKSLTVICDSMKQAIMDKCFELGMDLKSFIPLMNSNADIMIAINNNYYPLIAIGHLRLYESYNITALELQTALRLYSNSDPYYTDKLDYMNSKHKKIMQEFTGNDLE